MVSPRSGQGVPRSDKSNPMDRPTPGISLHWAEEEHSRTRPRRTFWGEVWASGTRQENSGEGVPAKKVGRGPSRADRKG